MFTLTAQEILACDRVREYKQNLWSVGQNGQPKRPVNCFILFKMIFCARFGRVRGVSPKDVWRNMSLDQKKPFEQASELLKAQHRIANPGYKFCPRKPVNVKRSQLKRESATKTLSRFHNLFPGDMVDAATDGQSSSSSSSSSYLSAPSPQSLPFSDTSDDDYWRIETDPLSLASVPPNFESHLPDTHTPFAFPLVTEEIESSSELNIDDSIQFFLSNSFDVPCYLDLDQVQLRLRGYY